MANDDLAMHESWGVFGDEAIAALKEAGLVPTKTLRASLHAAHDEFVVLKIETAVSPSDLVRFAVAVRERDAASRKEVVTREPAPEDG